MDTGMYSAHAGVERYHYRRHYSSIHFATLRSYFHKILMAQIFSPFIRTNVVMIPLIFITALSVSQGCNIDTTTPIIYRGETGSYFGYTVLQYDFLVNKNPFILVGAPRANSTHQSSLSRPGAVYKCNVVRPLSCVQLLLDNDDNEVSEGRIDDHNDQWLGVSLATTKQNGGLISACGHRYQNDFYLRGSNDTRDDKYPIGICYSFKPQLFRSEIKDLNKRFPCLDGDQWKLDNSNYSTRWYSWCQAGVSLAHTSDGTHLYGAPGAFNGSGTVISKMNGAAVNFTYHEPDLPPKSIKFKSDYKGYSVATGHFVGEDGEEQGVAGAPRTNQLGKVTVYNVSSGAVYQEIYGEPMNTYFGGAVAAVDVNNDGLCDLLVGAPLFSNDQDEGKVYVFLNTGGSENPLKLSQELQGSVAFRARFGSSISGIKDLNKDGYHDVLIGAPYEDDGTGAVYVYLGGADGLDPNFSKRISGADLNPKLKTFGISVHGGIDMDNSGYSDIVVGAYESDAVVLFKSKPILNLQAWLELNPQSLDPVFKGCTLNGQKYACLDVVVCFKFTTDIVVTIDVKIEYFVTVDEEKIAEGEEPRFLLTNDLSTMYNGSLEVKEDKKKCAQPIKAYLQRNARDLLSNVSLKLTYDVFKYPVQLERRGDIPYQFTQGIPPVSNGYNCGAQTVTEEVSFARNCGPDGICQTDLKLEPTVELPGGKTDELIQGTADNLYINARIENDGEDAHQAVLRIYHPSDMGYESVEIREVTCITSKSCIPEVVTSCSPQLAHDSSALVECSLGNPMNANNSALVRLRFDVSFIPWSIGRRINITLVVSTVSKETETQKKNNVKQLEYPLVIEADFAIVGTSKPESVYYGYNATSLSQKDQRAADEKKLKSSLEAANLAFEKKPYNETWIGPAFDQEFRVINNGSGRIPISSKVTIKIPWKTLDGNGWLIFIKDILIDGNKGSCNKASILDQQKLELRQVYSDGSTNYAKAEISAKPIMDCSKANCVSILCNIPQMERNAIVKITVAGLLWEHTFVTREYGLKELVTEVKVQTSNSKTESVEVKTIAYTSTMGKQPTPGWAIALAIIIGIASLVGLAGILYRVGFFKRKLKEEMEGTEADGAATEKNAEPETEYENKNEYENTPVPEPEPENKYEL